MFRKLYKKFLIYPGYVINFVLIAAAIFTVFRSSNDHNKVIQIKTSKVTGIIITRLNGYVDQLQQDCTSCMQNIVFDLELVMVDINKNETILGANSTSAKKKTDPYETKIKSDFAHFLNSLQLDSMIRNASKNTIDDAAASVSLKAATWLIEQDSLEKNRPIFFLWGVIALIYLVLVFIAYFFKVADSVSAEPLLNIIDFGLYLALIEYSGSLKSPIIYLLGFSLSVVLWDISNNNKNRSSMHIPHTKFQFMTRILTFIHNLGYITLYTFALLYGLVWSFLDESIYLNLSFQEFVFRYLKILLTIILIGFVGWLFLSALIAHGNKSILRQKVQEV